MVLHMQHGNGRAIAFDSQAVLLGKILPSHADIAVMLKGLWHCLLTNVPATVDTYNKLLRQRQLILRPRCAKEPIVSCTFALRQGCLVPHMQYI